MKKSFLIIYFIILLADARELLRYVAAPPPDILEVVEGFEEPTTVIYEHGLDLPENLLHASGSLAIRVTTDPFCKALIKRYQKPIVSTSANLSDQPSAPIYSAVDPLIVQRADYVVRYRQDDHTIRKPSRLVRLHDDGHIEIIRS